MTERTLQLDELKARPLEEVLREVVDHQQMLTVQLRGGDAITIQPASPLKPLPVLEGHVPEGWKDAIRK